MSVKKGILDNFLKPRSHYSDNKKNLRSIFIDRNEDDLKPEPLPTKSWQAESALFQNISANEGETSKFESDNVQQSAKYKRNHEFHAQVQRMKEHLNSTDNIIDLNPDKALAIREHNVSNTLASSEQCVSNTLAMREHNVSITSPIALAIREQESVNKSTDNVSITLAIREQKDWVTCLSGKEEKLLDLIFDNCQANGSLESLRLTSEYLIKCLDNISEERLRNLIYRLTKKNVLHVHSVKKGRGGWRKFYFTQEVFRLLHAHKALAIREQESVNKSTDNVSITSPITLANVSRRRSFNNINTSSIDEEWNFDISCYEKFGFTKSQIKQLQTVNKLSPEDVLQSLIEFEYDFTNNTFPKKIQNPLSYLMGGLIKGSPYTSVAYQNYMNEVVEEMKQRRKECERQQLELDIFQWFEKLSDDDKKIMKNTFPINIQIRYNSAGLWEEKVYLHVKEYYLTNNKKLIDKV